MAKLVNTIRVAVTPERAWAIVGDLDGVHRWIPGVTSCRMEGAKRICNEGQILEEISEYSAASRSYRYKHLKVPLPVKSSAGAFVVKPDNSGAVIVWEAEIEPLDRSTEPEFIQMVDGLYKQVCEALRQLIEAGSERGR